MERGADHEGRAGVLVAHGVGVVPVIPLAGDVELVVGQAGVRLDEGDEFLIDQNRSSSPRMPPEGDDSNPRSPIYGELAARGRARHDPRRQ
jgi:hypothetical protein